MEKQGINRQIPEKEILYFERLGHYIHLHTNKEVIIYKAKIGELWKKLEQNTSYAMANRLLWCT